MEVVKYVGKYLEQPVGPLCYNTDKVLTTVIDNENVEGFATIILRLQGKCDLTTTVEEKVLSYQWLEHLAVYINQAVTNPAFAKTFLQGIDSTLRKSSCLTGHLISVTDIAAYHALYPIIVTKSVPLWNKVPLPRQTYPHELKNVNLDDPVIYFPQPFSFPGYPVILYLKK